MNRNSRVILLFAFLLLTSFIACFAQTDSYMFRYSIKDNSGNLWFSNMGNGVYRYNSATDDFTHFTKEDGLNDNNVESIYEDKAGHIWFSTEHGVCRYDPSPDNKTSDKLFIDVSTQAGLFKNDINCIIEDRKGNIWIGSNGWGVCRYNPVSGEVKYFTKEQGLGSNAVQCMLEDKAGNLWCGERAGGVSRFDASSEKFTKINGDGCFSSQIMDIKEDKDGNIWFANLYEGLCRYDPSADLKPGVKAFTHFTEENGLCNDTLTCLYQDNNGVLWIGSEGKKYGASRGGICCYNASAVLNKGEKSFTHLLVMDGSDAVGVWTIVEDNNGVMWVGSRSGLFRYHSGSGKFVNYTHKVKGVQ